MKLLSLLGLSKEKRIYPRNLTMYDFAKIHQSEHEKIVQMQRFSELKKDLSEKIAESNTIKFFKLQKALQIIEKYESLNKEIWG